MGNVNFASISASMAQLRTKFIVHDRYDHLEEQFRLLLQRRRMDIKLGQIDEARGIAVIGASGSGKTTAVDRLISSCPDITHKGDDGQVDVISLRVPSPATLKYVGQTILRALGYELGQERQAWYIWDLIRHHLKERRVLFLHLDEAQDLSAKGTQREMQSVVNMLKSLMQDSDWPVGILLSGTPELTEILNFDPQLGRRFFPLRFEPINPATDTVQILQLVAAYIDTAKATKSPDLDTDDFAERLIHASSNEFGILIEMTIGAIEEMLIAGRTCLDICLFADAFRRRSGCVDALNPFLTSEFERIDARQLLGQIEVAI